MIPFEHDYYIQNQKSMDYIKHINTIRISFSPYLFDGLF